jgi:flagellar basal body-associated protein FliL
MRLILSRSCLALAVLLLAAAPAMADDAKDPADAKKPDHKMTQAESYLSVDPFYTTIVTDNHAGGMLMVGIGLDVPDVALRDEVTRSMPVLRDAYLRNLMAFTANAVRIDAQPDVAAIAGRLQDVTDRALKKKGARVLLAQVALRVTR